MTHSTLAQWFKFCPHCQQPLTLTANSAKCGWCDFVHYLNPAPAVTVIVEKAGQILIAKRAIEPQQGMWDLPGGFVNVSERVEDCVLREVKEETNLEVKIERYLGSAPDVYGQTGKPTLNLLYWTKYQAGTPLAQDDVAELKWLEYAHLPQKFAFKNCRIALEIYASYFYP